jgi:protein-tyrosine phosphatase
MAELADFESHKIEGFAREGGKNFRVSLYSHIVGNLWTGGCPNPEAPQEFQFIVCLYPWEPYGIHDHQVMTTAKLFDAPGIPCERLLYMLAAHVNECMKIGKTLVHCQAGLNRSGLIAGLALITQGMKPDEAIALLREKRCDAVLCNRVFENWLRART